MKQLTLRGFDASLEEALRRLAGERQISLNRAALELMRRGAGLADRAESDASGGAALDSFIGVWTTRDEKEILAAIEPLERIDPELWS
jgi:hypothetical protein